MTTDQNWPPIVDRDTWNDARAVLLQQEKALTRMKDSISAARRRMPMVEVRSDYAFEGPGKALSPCLTSSTDALNSSCSTSCSVRIGRNGVTAVR